MQEHEFQIGRRYRNRKSHYEVLDIHKGKITVRYDDGEKATIDARLAARIHSNMEHEDTRQLPRGVTKLQETDFAWTLGVLGRHGDFQVDMPPRSVAGFMADYRSITGVTTLDGVRGVVVLQHDTDKWGVELRIYLPESVTEHSRFVLPEGVEVSAGFGQGTKRINKNWFWWHLVQRLRFRIGNRQELNAIEQALPEHLRSAFREGAALQV